MTLSDLNSQFNAILPIVILIISAIILLLVGLWLPKRQRWLVPLLTAVSMLCTLVLVVVRSQESSWAFSQMILVDGFSAFVSAVLLISGIVAVILSIDYFHCSGEGRFEYFILLLIAVAGMMLMAASADLIITFLALELLSLPLYVMVASACSRSEAEEASIKYFLLGAFAGGFFLYGVALIFGATGYTSLTEIVTAYQTGLANTKLLIVGSGLVLVGLGFKIAIVPFHMWTPDVYQGAPSPVTAFMSVAVKAAAFAALLRIFQMALSPVAENLSPLIWMLAALTMLLGNLAALAQNNLRRMLAYSSIAHAGYMLVPMVTLGNTSFTAESIGGVLFYLLTYGIGSLGAWTVVGALENETHQQVEISDMAGLARKSPLLAACMTVFMFSFIGMPPTLGFVGKFFVFSSAISAGQVTLALVGVIASLISAGYYLRVVVMMYMRDGEPIVRHAWWLKLIAALAALGLIIPPLFGSPMFLWLWHTILGIPLQ